VPVDRAARHAGRRGDFRQRRMADTTLLEDALRRIKDRVSRLLSFFLRFPDHRLSLPSTRTARHAV